jgi:hypothetical protein
MVNFYCNGYDRLYNRNCLIALVSMKSCIMVVCVHWVLTDQNCMQEQIKSRLNSGNACYHSVHSLLSSACCLGT